MGIKNWIGKSLLNLLQETKQREVAQSSRTQSAMTDMLTSSAPAIMAWKINNGFIVRTMDSQAAYVGSQVGGFHFCKDHAEIAQHIVSSEAKRKLGIGEEYQQDMFAAEKARAVATQRNVVGAPIGRSI